MRRNHTLFTLFQSPSEELSFLFLLFFAASLIIVIIALVCKIREKNQTEDRLREHIGELDKNLDALSSVSEKNIRICRELSNCKDKLSEYNKVIQEQQNETAQLSKNATTVERILENQKRINQNLVNEISIKDDELIKAKDKLKNQLQLAESNLTLFPVAAEAYADYCTWHYEQLARELDWGCNVQRQHKVESIRDIRAKAKEQIELNKLAEYNLTYLLNLYPALSDVLEIDYKELDSEFNFETDYDPIRNYLSKDEWLNLSTTEKNQLALDRYIESRKKSKWQIGRDYELYIGYRYEKQGYNVEYTGSNLGLEDLGRDLIVSKDDKTVIVQCKYWGKEKQIHEKHIMQLFGKVTAYNIEHSFHKKASGILITNIGLSETAKKYADTLSIKYSEYQGFGEFPRIKCNIGKDEYGNTTYIYHLPMDIQYDKVKICKPGEKTVFTIKEAEGAGFRRAFKWHGNI